MNRYILVLFMLSLTTQLSAQLQNFLKPALDKRENHSIAGVDFIYMINLDQRPEKFASCTDQLTPYGINPYRFSAVNGWELSLDTINALGVKYNPATMSSLIRGNYFSEENGGKPADEIMHVPGKTYFCHGMGRGPIGIVLSHLSVLQDAYDAGYKRIWVMEDDIQLIKNPHLISYAISKLDHLVGKHGWDILFTDKDTKNHNGDYVQCFGYAPRPNFSPHNPERFAQRKRVSSDFIKTGARYGTYSMIIQRSGMKKILDFFKQYQVFLPYDMEYYLINDIQLYTVANDIVSTQPQALSDNGSPAYLKKEALQKDIPLLCRNLVFP